MSTRFEPYTGENGGFGYSNGAHGEDVEQLESFGVMDEGNRVIFSPSLHIYFHIAWSHLIFRFLVVLHLNYAYIGNQQSSRVEWLNDILPHMILPSEASEEELRECLDRKSVV